LDEAAGVRQHASRPAPPHEQHEVDALLTHVRDAGEGAAARRTAPRTWSDEQRAGQLTTP
jgi:hypothetical protein